MTNTSNLLEGKRGLIMGVANDRSIGWGIAKARQMLGLNWLLLIKGKRLKNVFAPWLKAWGPCAAL